MRLGWNGQTDGLMDGLMDGWMEGWVDWEFNRTKGLETSRGRRRFSICEETRKM